MASIFLLIPLSLMLFVVAIWAIRFAVKSDQFDDLDNASQRIILEDRQERRQVLQQQNAAKPPSPTSIPKTTDSAVPVDVAVDGAADSKRY